MDGRVGQNNSNEARDVPRHPMSFRSRQEQGEGFAPTSDHGLVQTIPPDMDDSSDIWELEDTYLALIQDSLPRLSSRYRPFVKPHLYIVDMESDVMGLRHVRPMAPDAWLERVTERVQTVLEQATDEIAKEYDITSDLQALGAGVRKVRTLLARENLPLDALEWAMPPRLPTLGVLDRLEEMVNRWMLYPSLVDQVDNRESFVRVLGVLSSALRDLPHEQLDDIDVSRVSVVEFPFSALGSPRAVSLWLLISPDEVPDLEEHLSAHFAETLERLFSAAVIDVLSAHLMRQVGQATTLGGGEAQEVATRVLSYLFPATSLELFGPGEPVPAPSAELCHTVYFRQEGVRRFLGVAAVRYQLLHSMAWDADSPVARTYMDMLESKIRDLAMTAAHEMDDQYGKLLGVFGHHTGTLFKTSGAFQVWQNAGQDIAPTALEAKRVLDRLLPIWGISKAISLVQKQSWDDELPMPESWFDKQTLQRSPEEIGRGIEDAVRALVRYVFEHGQDDAPFLTWVLVRNGEREPDWVWDEDHRERKAMIETLPPFADDPIVLDKTLAATIGLFEMMVNLRKYPPPRGPGRSVRKLLARLAPEDREVVMDMRTEQGVLRLSVEQPIVLDAGGNIPASRSLERIRLYERQCLRGYVATSALEMRRTTSHPRAIRVWREWVFRWEPFLDRFRRYMCRES